MNQNSSKKVKSNNHNLIIYDKKILSDNKHLIIFYFVPG